MFFRVIYKEFGGHTHMSLFSGENSYSLGLAGNLCMTNDEFDFFRLSCKGFEFLEDLK